MPWPSLGCSLDAGSGLLLVALGVAVAMVRPRRRLNAALAVFSAGWGAGAVLSNLQQRPDCGLHLGPDLSEVPAAVAGIAIVALVLLYPTPLPRRRAAMLILPAALMGPYGIAWWLAERSVGFAVLRSALVAALAILAVRAVDAQRHGAGGGRSVALFATALVIEPALRAGAVARTDGWSVGIGVFGLALCVLVAGAWLWTAVTASALRAPALRVAWLALGLPVLGMLLGRWIDAFDGGPMGAARTLTVLLVAHAILRHQLLGIDVKIKWTIRQSTVAAVFLAVFFAASEGAQAMFSDKYGTVAGIVAAGALVFAIHPLQHAAARVADKAMPGVKAPNQMSADERVRIYREQATAAWSDGALSRDERVLLDRLRDTLGLTKDQAATIESDAARSP